MRLSVSYKETVPGDWLFKRTTEHTRLVLAGNGVESGSEESNSSHASVFNFRKLVQTVLIVFV
jgi:hypothetical protein